MSTVIEIGPHRLLCADITEPGTLEPLMLGSTADLIYSDPPWGPGNQQYWHTMNHRGSVPRTSWSGFLWAFAAVCAGYRKPAAPVFVEMGLRWTDDLDLAMEAAGLPLLRRWSIFYGPKRKPLENTVALFGAPAPEFTLPDPPHGEPVTRAIVGACVKPGDLVLDPCTGLGMTARCTVDRGGVFRGTELNPERLEKTAARLCRALGALS